MIRLPKLALLCLLVFITGSCTKKANPPASVPSADRLEDVVIRITNEAPAVGDTLRIEGSFRPVKPIRRFPVSIFVRSRPEEQVPFTNNSCGAKAEMDKDGRYSFSGELSAPAAPGTYDVVIQAGEFEAGKAPVTIKAR